MRSRRCVALVGVLWACLGFSPCELPEDEPPGDVVGTFDVLGAVAEHTCGSAIPNTDGRILADVWRDDTEAFWQTFNGPLVAGLIIDDEYRFREPQTLELTPADRRFGVAACVVSRTDTITFTVTEPAETKEEGSTSDAADAGTESESDDATDVMTLRGVNTIEFAPLAGSDCRFAVVTGGGDFLTLPCRVEYTLSGERVDAE